MQVNNEASHRVSLRFPSFHSLRAHFSDRSQRRKLPDLDEMYVTGSDTAARVLRRRIPPLEMAETVEPVMTRRSSKRKKKLETKNNIDDKPGSSRRLKRKKRNPSENARSGKKTLFKNSIERWSEAR